MTDSNDILNLNRADPFNEPLEDEANNSESVVHIRRQQRNGRKCLTTIQGLPSGLNFKKIVKYFKKEFCCNGTIVEDEELGTIVQLQGDQRSSAAKFLVDEKLVPKDNIKIHGY